MERLTMYAPPATPKEKRQIQREVALAYRRTYRAGKSARLSPPEYQQRAVDAALAAYLRLDPGGSSDRLEASAIVNLMIANAIKADFSGSGMALMSRRMPDLATIIAALRDSKSTAKSRGSSMGLGR